MVSFRVRLALTIQSILPQTFRIVCLAKLATIAHWKLWPRQLFSQSLLDFTVARVRSVPIPAQVERISRNQMDQRLVLCRVSRAQWGTIVAHSLQHGTIPALKELTAHRDQRTRFIAPVQATAPAIHFRQLIVQLVTIALLDQQCPFSAGMVLFALPELRALTCVPTDTFQEMIRPLVGKWRTRVRFVPPVRFRQIRCFASRVPRATFVLVAQQLQGHWILLRSEGIFAPLGTTAHLEAAGHPLALLVHTTMEPAGEQSTRVQIVSRIFTSRTTLSPHVFDAGNRRRRFQALPVVIALAVIEASSLATVRAVASQVMCSTLRARSLVRTTAR